MKATGRNGAGAASDSTTATAAEQRYDIPRAATEGAAVVQVVRPTRPSNYAREHHLAAIVIQTTFRGYLVQKSSSCRKFVFIILTFRFRISAIVFLRTDEKNGICDCEGQESSSCTERISEIASFGKRSQCEKASQDDTQVHASSG